MEYQFYQIKSNKSLLQEDGSQQISLSCIGEPLIKFFLWFQGDNKISHIQFFFDEKVLEWFQDQGIVLSVTNRFEAKLLGHGVQKGSRNLTTTDDINILSEAVDILNQSSIPEPYQETIQQCLIKNLPQPKE